MDSFLGLIIGLSVAGVIFAILGWVNWQLNPVVGFFIPFVIVFIFTCVIPYAYYWFWYTAAMIVPGIGTGLLSKYKWNNSFLGGFLLGYLIPIIGWFVFFVSLTAKTHVSSMENYSRDVYH